MSNIGDRVRFAMDKAGLNQSELARISRVPEPTISRLLTGKRRNPNSATLEAIATALGVTTDQLLGIVRSPSLTEIRRLAAEATPAARQFLSDLEEDYYTASDETWRVLTQVFQAMILRDRTNQIEEGQRRPATDAPTDDPGNTMQAVHPAA